MPLAVVGEPLAGVPQHLGQQLGQGHLLGQCDVDPPLGALMVTRASPIVID